MFFLRMLDIVVFFVTNNLYRKKSSLVFGENIFMMGLKSKSKSELFF